ncbi:glycosyltransferase family 1 protein [Bacillus canaveralius]|nr:glycosyltransferase family 1 protein [Bacillus canaveralius]
MKPIRILQVVTIMNRGGLETMLMNYYRQINRSKIQFDFMVHRDEEGHYDQEILNLGGKIYRMPQIKPGNYRLYFQLLDDFFVNHPEYKVVHAHINENSSFVLRAAKRAGVQCRIAHSHTSDLGIDYKLPFRLYARTVMKNNPSEYFACSNNAAEWLFGKKKIDADKVTILKNAINLDEFKYNEKVRIDTRGKLNIKDQLVIGHVGRFHKSKNHEFLVDVFKSIHKRHPSSMLLLVGEGDTRLTIEKKVANLGLHSAVKFLGLRKDITQLMQAMDLFLFPSFFEGAPVALIEAQAAGLQCVVSDTISKESNLTGLVKYLNIRDSSEVWADKILNLSFEHTDTSQQLVKNGYDIVTMANSLSKYYIEKV